MRIVSIDMSDAPRPPRLLPADLVVAALHGAWLSSSLFVGAYITGALLFVLLSTILTQRPLTGSGPPAWIGSSLLLAFIIAIIVGCVWAVGHEIRRRGWRVPHYNVSMAAVSAALRRRRRFERFTVGISRLWGLLWLAAGALVWGAPAFLGLTWEPFVRALPDPWRDLANMTLVISLLALILGLASAGVAQLRGKLPSLRYVASMLLRMVPFAAGFVTLFAVTLVFDQVFDIDIDAGPETIISLIASLIGAMVAAVGAFFLVSKVIGPRAHLLAQPSVDAVRRNDWRPPVLFLRSFHDDARQIAIEPGLDDVSPFSSSDDTMTNFEDALLKEVRLQGPAIAIGQPGTTPDGGAARAYIDGEGWRDTVLEWMDEAQLIVMVAGYTHGLYWELENVIKRGHQAKAVLVFPPNDPHRKARWEWVSAAFRGTAIGAAMLETTSEHVIALHQNKAGELVVLRSKSENQRNYQAALAVVLFESNTA
jgi:hypothetical protein